ncbi:MAG TPA: HD domain-containing protein, partial [Anaerolineales bacterium]|nr:HD domain-containing protein [Anaerolineales bacterium]
MPDHTRTVPDFAAARSYVLDRLERELSPRLVYHSVVHTRDDILPALERLAEREGITDEHELVVLRTAGLYHDIGFTETYAGHEIASIRIAAETLPGFGYSQAQIEQICHLIEATEMPQNPDSRLAKLLADADLDILGREDFLIRNRDLYRELADMGKDFTLTEWCSSQLTLLQTHRYFTRAATELRQAGKEQNMARLQDQLAGSSNPDSPATGKASTGEKIEDILARIPLFTTLPKEELAHLGKSLQLSEYPVPTLLFREGDHGDFMYLVIEGFIEIFKALGTPDERRIGLRGSGEY